jgi:hypothetical protein
MTIDWQAMLAAVDAAIPNAGPIREAIGKSIRARLASSGARYSSEFPPGSPNTLQESSAHVAWRAMVARAITELDQIAERAESEAGVAHPNPSGTIAQARERLQKASTLPGVNETTLALAKAARAATLPAEPQFYVAAHYVKIPNTQAKRGDIELEVQELVNEASAWLSLG